MNLDRDEIIARLKQIDEDIENELVYKELDWDLMDKLIEDVCYGMLYDFSETALRENYNDYKERFK